MDSHSPYDPRIEGLVREPSREFAQRKLPADISVDSPKQKLDPLQLRARLREQSQSRQLRKPGHPSGQDRNRQSFAQDKHGEQSRDQVRPDRVREMEHSPKRPKRASHPSPEIGIQMRPEERTVLQEVGKFRIVSTHDLAEFMYRGNVAQLQRDLGFLKDKGLVKVHVLNTRRDGQTINSKRFEAVTLTGAGERLLQKSAEIDPHQRVYSGLVKPGEAEHDTQIYRAYRKEIVAIERSGGYKFRVSLDFELKARMNRCLYLARKAQPDRNQDEVKTEVAGQLQLKLANNKVIVPDLRIEYDMPGGESAHTDIEIATSAYRHGHLAAKVRAGFKIYAGTSDIGRLGAAIQNDPNIMSEILSL